MGVTSVTSAMPTFTEAALDVAAQLAEAAVPVEGGVAWRGPVPLATDGDVLQITIADTGRDLYNGSAGIGLFLAAAAVVSADDALAGAARAAIQGALRWSEAAVPAGRLGLMDGATGVAVAALEAGRLLGDVALEEAGVTVGGRVASASSERPVGGSVDLTVGDAGVLLGLLALDGAGAWRAQLHTLAGRLAAAGRPAAWGRAWPDPADPPDRPALLGMAHGAAGIALALREAAAALGDQDNLTSAANDAIRYERSHFSPMRSNWPDLRDRGGARGTWPGWPVYWCHGAIGIGLARLRDFSLTGEPWALAEASAALQASRDVVVRTGTAVRSGAAPGDCCLCHGLAGASSLLLEAHAVGGAREHLGGARRVGQLMLETRATAGAWPCGLQGAGEVPGLFLGLAGIGLALLRLDRPTLAPNPCLPGPGGRAVQGSNANWNVSGSA